LWWLSFVLFPTIENKQGKPQDEYEKKDRVAVFGSVPFWQFKRGGAKSGLGPLPPRLP
jgi:hypothetical protein